MAKTHGTGADARWKGFTDWVLDAARTTKPGRGALRRQWRSLRDLAESVLKELSNKEVEQLLGKTKDKLDPELNDLKAVVAYGAGRGLLREPELLCRALADEEADPLAFLAALSGKSFGESWAPKIAAYWLLRPGDTCDKKKAKDFYDLDWFPKELSGRAVRIELKASSEHPNYRFQQIRHPRHSGGPRDYDMLLCLGVTASSLEWWVMPSAGLDEITENGKTPTSKVVITAHHGKRRPIWSDQAGYKDEGWFVADERSRPLLAEFLAESPSLRKRVLRIVSVR